MTVLYGSSVADSVLTTACKMATIPGGVETSAISSFPATETHSIGELFSQGVNPATGVAAIPATPTGHGWIYFPGAGTFTAGNWTAAVGLSDAVGSYPFVGTMRVFKYSSGLYTLVGTITTSSAIMQTTRTVQAFGPGSLPSVTLLGTEGIYFDLWDDVSPSTINNATPRVYESTTATSGVANDMQVTTPAFVPAHYTSATCVTRDMQAQAVTRDEKAVAKTRG